MDPSETSHPKLSEAQSRVFKVVGDKVLIGGVEATPQLRDSLRTEAEYIIGSRLWEVFNAAIMDEEYQLGVVKSAGWDHVLSAKMLHHWAHFFRNALYTLAK
jgi:hypothetical protein